MNLDTWMTRHKLTDQAAADATGLSRGYFSRIRRGAVHPNLGTALLIFDWTGGVVDLRSMVPAGLANRLKVKPAKFDEAATAPVAKPARGRKAA